MYIHYSISDINDYEQQMPKMVFQ